MEDLYGKHQNELHFVDIEKAYDRVPREKLILHEDIRDDRSM